MNDRSKARGTKLFKSSLLTWRANYLASKANAANAPAEGEAPPSPQPRTNRSRLIAARR